MDLRGSDPSLECLSSHGWIESSERTLNDVSKKTPVDHGALAQALAALDKVAGARSAVIDEELELVCGALPPGLPLHELQRTETSSWVEIGDCQVLTTRFRGIRSTPGWIVSVFATLDEDRRGAVETLYRLVRLVESNNTRLATELDETRLMFQAVLDTIPVRVFWKDLDSVYLGANRLFAKDSGYDNPDELIGKTDFDMSFHEQADLYRGDDHRVMSSGQAKIDYEEPQTTPNGDRIWLQTSKIPIRSLSNQIIGVLGSYRDITARKEAEAERERLLADLESKNSELERFTYTVSHDLKSPLVTIGGFLGVLERDLRKTPGIAPRTLRSFVDSIERIRRASAKMSQLLDDLLDISRVGRILRPTRPVELRSLVDDALLLCDGALRDAEATVRIEGEFPVVQVDGPRIVQVFQNLLDNACKYRNPREALVLRITSRSNGAACVVCVADNGIGIAEPYHQRVFRLFEKLDPESAGSGIGLALVKRIVESHGGTVRIESEGPGGGSAFRLGLPLTGDLAANPSSAADSAKE